MSRLDNQIPDSTIAAVDSVGAGYYPLAARVPHPARNPMQPADGETTAWEGQAVVDHGGEHLGTVAAVVVDPETDRRFVVLRTIHDDDWYTLAPAKDATADGDRVRLGAACEQVRRAPHSRVLDAYRDGVYRSQHYRHYGLRGPRRRATPSALSKELSEDAA